MKKALAIILAVIMLSALVLPFSAMAASMPPELSAVAANDIGVWPMAAGAYDPSLDGKGILDGTHIYGCYDFDFTTYIITPKDVPESLEGYTKVDTPADMTEGTYCVLTITGAPDYDYVLVMPAGGAAAEPAPTAAAAPTASPAASAPPASTGGGGSVTVTMTVSVPDGEGSAMLAVAAQPITCSGSLDSALRALADQFYDGSGTGVGYDASINPTFGMFLVNSFWGVDGVPVCMINGEPMGYDTTLPYTVDARMLEDGDNIIVAVSGNPVNVSVVYNADENAIMSQRWIFNSSTYSYTNETFANADVVDAETGKVLGKTNAMGRLQLSGSIDCGVVSIAGVAAAPTVAASQVKSFTPAPVKYTPPKADYSVFGGASGQALLRIVVVCLALTIPLGAVVLHAQRTEIRNRGRKYTQPLISRK